MKIISIQPSYYFTNAIVFITSCGHSHVRPATWNYKIGDEFKCYCEDNNEPK